MEQPGWRWKRAHELASLLVGIAAAPARALPSNAAPAATLRLAKLAADAVGDTMLHELAACRAAARGHEPAVVPVGAGGHKLAARHASVRAIGVVR